MAKPFYDAKEACRILACDDKGLRDFVADGALREFRDAGNLFFKSDDVDRLAKRRAGASSSHVDIFDGILDESSDPTAEDLVLDLEPQPKARDLNRDAAPMLARLERTVRHLEEAAQTIASQSELLATVRALKLGAEFPLPTNPADAAKVLGVDTATIIRLGEIWARKGALA